MVAPSAAPRSTLGGSSRRRPADPTAASSSAASSASTIGAATAAATEPVRVVVRLRPEPIEDSDASSSFSSSSSDDDRDGAVGAARQRQRRQERRQLCVFAEGETRVSIVSSSKDHLSRTVASAARGAASSRLRRQTEPSLEKQQQTTQARSFSLDRVFGPSTPQRDVYEEAARPLVRSVVDGFNASVLAYGVTGSGKSYTMFGPALGDDGGADEDQEDGGLAGIVPRAIADLFALIEQSTEAALVRLTFVELYQNAFRNLLAPDNGGGSSSGSSKGQHQPSKPIDVREAPDGQVFLDGPPGLSVPVTSAAAALGLVRRGLAARATGATRCNSHSSRSHAILSFSVETRGDGGSSAGASGGGAVRMGKLHLVDLAGSERLSLSGAEGARQAETQSINLSLTALSNVLSTLSRNALAAQQQQQQPPQSKPGAAVASSALAIAAGTAAAPAAAGLLPVPYRQSKLTFLLKDSLGGNSRTIMIANVRASLPYKAQTLTTLQYAARARNVQNFTLVNVDVAGHSQLTHVSTEIERLKRRLRRRAAELDRMCAAEEEEEDVDEEGDLSGVEQQQRTQEAGRVGRTTRRQRLEEMGRAMARERQELAEKLSQVILSPEGKNKTKGTTPQAGDDCAAELEGRLQRELAKYEDTCLRQQQEIEGLRGAVEDLQFQASTAASESQAHAAAQADAAAAAAAVAAEERAQMQRAVEGWRQQASATQEQLLKAQAQLRGLRAEAEKERGLREGAEAALVRARREVEGLLSDLAVARRAQGKAEEVAAAAEAQRGEAERTTKLMMDAADLGGTMQEVAATLKREMGEAKVAIEGEKARLRALRAEEEGLRAQVGAAEAATARAREQLEAEEMAAREAEAAVGGWRERRALVDEVTGLRAALKRKDDELDESQRACTALESKFASALSEMEERFRSVVQEKDARLASAEKRRAAAEAVHDQLAESRLPALEEELARARAQMERLLKEGKDAADAWRGKVAALEAESERQRRQAAERVAGLDEEVGALQAAARRAAEAEAMWVEEKKALLGGFEVERQGLRLDADALRAQIEALQALAAEAEERAAATTEDLSAKLRAAEAQLSEAHARWEGERAELQRSVEAATAATADLQRLHEEEMASLGREKKAAAAAAAAAVEEAREEGRRVVKEEVEARAAAVAASLGLAWRDGQEEEEGGEDWAAHLEGAVRRRLEADTTEAEWLREEKAAALGAVAQYAQRLRALVADVDPEAVAILLGQEGDGIGEGEGDAAAALCGAAASVDWLLERARAETEAAWAARLAAQEEEGRAAMEAVVAAAEAARVEAEEDRRAAVEATAAEWRARLEEATAARAAVEAEAARARALVEEQAAEFRGHLERFLEEHEDRVQAAVAAEHGEWVARWEAATRRQAEELVGARDGAKREADAAWEARLAEMLGEKEKYYQRQLQAAERAAKAAVDEMRAQMDMDAHRQKEDWEGEARAGMLAEARAAALREVGEREEEMRLVLAEVQAQVASATKAVEMAQAEADARVRVAVEAARREAWERDGRWEREVTGLRRRVQEAEAALKAAAAAAQAEAGRRAQEEQEQQEAALVVSAVPLSVGVQTEAEDEDEAPPPAAGVAPAAVAAHGTSAQEQQPTLKATLVPAAAASTCSSTQSALRSALLAGDAARVRALLPSIDDGLLPIHTAIQGLVFHGSLPRLLATLDALSASHLTAADERGDTCLHLALRLPSLSSAAAVMEKLLSLGVTGLLVTATNAEGKTPLHLAVARAVACSAEGVALLRRLVLALEGDGTAGQGKGKGTAIGGPSLLAAALVAVAASEKGVAAPAAAGRSRRGGAGVETTAAAMPRALEVLSLLQGAGLAAWDARWREPGTGRTQGELLAGLAPEQQHGGDKARLVYDKLVRAALAGGVLVPRVVPKR